MDNYPDTEGGAPRSGRLQPMLVDLDVDRVVRRSSVIGPDRALCKAHTVEWERRQAIAAESKLLGVGEAATQPLDATALAADVEGCADMAGRKGAPHTHRIAGLELCRHAGLTRFRRAVASAMRRPSSSVVITPRACGASAPSVRARSSWRPRACSRGGASPPTGRPARCLRSSTQTYGWKPIRSSSVTATSGPLPV